MSRMRLLLLAGLVLAGCSTTYKKGGDGWITPVQGYHDTVVDKSEGVYTVEYKGARQDSVDSLKRLAHRRARELCERRSKGEYAVIEEGEDTHRPPASLFTLPSYVITLRCGPPAATTAQAPPEQPAQATPAGTRRLAVLEFRGDEADLKVRIVLAEEARAGALDALRGTPWMVLTRESMAVVLKDMGRCTAEEGECEVETARNIGANAVVSGEMFKVGSKLRLGLKLHNAENGALLSSQLLSAATVDGLVDQVRSATAQMTREGMRL